MREAEGKTRCENEICSLGWKKEQGIWTVSVLDCNDATSLPLYSMKWNEEKGGWDVYLNTNKFSMQWNRKDKKWTVNKNGGTEQENPICSMCCNNGKWAHPPKKFFAIRETIYENYREKRDKQKNVNSACVWVLRESKTLKNIIQVGRSSNLENMWENDIKKDVLAFFSDNGKYSELRTNCQKQDAYQLTFYEVDIETYIEQIKSYDNIFNPIKPIINVLENDNKLNEHIQEAYNYIIAAYVEGKLGHDSKNKAGDEYSLYNPSKLDGYFYEYFEYFDSQKK